MRACAFFPPSLDPVLDRRAGDKDTGVSPQVPTRRAIGQAVLDHQPYRQIKHTVGVLTARWRQIGEGRMKVCAALRTVVLRIGDHEIPRTPHVEIPEVVQRSIERFVPLGLMATTRTRLSLVAPTVWANFWRREVGNRCDPFGGSGSIRTRTAHGFVLRARMLGPQLYDKGPVGAIPKPGKDAIVSIKPPIFMRSLAIIPSASKNITAVIRTVVGTVSRSRAV
jgi:hypothetical protein